MLGLWASCVVFNKNICPPKCSSDIFKQKSPFPRWSKLILSRDYTVTSYSMFLYFQCLLRSLIFTQCSWFVKAMKIQFSQQINYNIINTLKLHLKISSVIMIRSQKAVFCFVICMCNMCSDYQIDFCHQKVQSCVYPVYWRKKNRAVIVFILNKLT